MENFDGRLYDYLPAKQQYLAAWGDVHGCDLNGRMENVAYDYQKFRNVNASACDMCSM
jgi:hypothetical protein